MRRIFKIILAIFAILIIVAVAVFAVIFFDLAAYSATGSETLPPLAASVGNALVVYDPGLSGTAKGVAFKIASDLQIRGYTVNLAGVKSSAASYTTGYRVIVVGGPIYAGSLTGSIKDFLSNLKADHGTKVGVFGSGSGATSADDIAQIVNSSAVLQDDGLLSEALVAKIGSGEDLDVRSADFVVQLLK